MSDILSMLIRHMLRMIWVELQKKTTKENERKQYKTKVPEYPFNRKLQTR